VKQESPGEPGRSGGRGSQPASYPEGQTEAARTFTESEQEAFGRVLMAFPGSKVGDAILNGDEPRPIDDPVLDEPDPDVLVPLDFARLLAEGIPEIDYLHHPYVVGRARIWAFGATESAKSIYFQWLAAKLTREGRTVVYVSAENPLQTDLDRMSRLRPDFSRLRYFHMPPLDLNDRGHFLRLAEACGDADLLVLDTQSALWSGDENSNREIVALDRDVLVPLVRLTGASIVMIHHVGHPQAFISRGGPSAGRGASAMAQKADIVMVFQAVGDHEFTIEHAKNRTPGGHKEPKARFHIIDTEDGGLDIERIGKEIDERVAESMEAAVEVVTSSDGALGTNALTQALKELGFGGSTIDRMFTELRAEDPPRLRQSEGYVVGADGKHRKGKPWVLA
jgi:hypothetical protein